MPLATIRDARPDEAALLTELALRSKAVWGYDEAFLVACREALTVTPSDVTGGGIAVVEADDTLAGFYRLVGTPPEGELSDLWVDPSRMRAGIGAHLLRHACTVARRRGFTSLLVESDPHAEGFYASFGASRVGERESTVERGRLLPLFRLNLVEGS